MEWALLEQVPNFESEEAIPERDLSWSPDGPNYWREQPMDYRDWIGSMETPTTIQEKTT